MAAPSAFYADFIMIDYYQKKKSDQQLKHDQLKCINT